MTLGVRIVVWSAGVIAVVLILGFIALALFAEQTRERVNYCQNCGISNYRLYYIVNVFGSRWKIPCGSDESNTGNNLCPHHIIKVQPDIY